MGTFVGLIIEDLSKVSSTPIWGDAIGIIIGCLIGVAIPKAIMSGSETSGLNKVHTNAAFIGDLSTVQLEMLLEGKSILEYRAMSSFDQLDENDSGTLDLDEIKG